MGWGTRQFQERFPGALSHKIYHDISHHVLHATLHRHFCVMWYHIVWHHIYDMTLVPCMVSELCNLMTSQHVTSCYVISYHMHVMWYYVIRDMTHWHKSHDMSCDANIVMYIILSWLITNVYLTFIWQN
jgi:hypothetical protein